MRPDTWDTASWDGDAMHIRHYSKGKFYRIQCPEGTKVVRRRPTLTSSDGSDLPDLLLVPFQGQTIPIPSDPPELLPMLAESGRCGLSLVGSPQPKARLAGV